MNWNVESPRYPFGWVRPPKELALTDDSGGRIVYRPERTCRVERVVHPDGEIEGYMCVSCGYSFMPDAPNYCPNCGARVEGE